MSPVTADVVASLEAERLRPVPPPPAEYPDGPSAHLSELPPPRTGPEEVRDAGR